MIAFICLFFPGVLAVGIYETLFRRETTWKSRIYHYCGYTLFIHWGCFAIKKFILGNAQYPLYENAKDMLPSTFVNYLLLAAPVACILILLEIFLSKHVKLSVEESGNEEDKN